MVYSIAKVVSKSLAGVRIVESLFGACLPQEDIFCGVDLCGQIV